MKKIIFILAAVIIALGISAIKQHYYQVTQTQHKPEPIEQVITPQAAAAPVEEAPIEEPPSIQASQPTTCREAIDQVWPTALREGAKIVLVNENGSENIAAVGVENTDGSQDFGCFQINDRWHPAYFSDGDWKDPVWAAQYALKIYEGRQQSEGNGWRAWYAVQGILW